MALIDAKTAAQLEPLGLKLFANVCLGHIDPQLIATSLISRERKNKEHYIYSYSLKFKAPVIVWSGSSLNTCVMGAYSYVNANSTLNLCTVGNYCSLASELKLGLPRHCPNHITTSSSFYSDLPFLNAWRGQPTRAAEPLQCPITIGHDVWIGNNVIIPAHRPITISTGAVIAAGSIVTHDVPPYAVVGGNPARVIKQRFSDEICADLMFSRWFDYDLPRSAHCAELSLNDPKLFLERFVHYRKDMARIPDEYVTLA